MSRGGIEIEMKSVGGNEKCSSNLSEKQFMEKGGRSVNRDVRTDPTT